MAPGSHVRYLPFGGVRTDAGTVTQTDFGYTGQRNLDAQGNSFSLGLMDYHARFYDQNIGRFVQPDSITPGGPQGLNRYSYVHNNPIRFNDPSGHCIGPMGVSLPDGSAACGVGGTTPAPSPSPTNPCQINPGLGICNSGGGGSNSGRGDTTTTPTPTPTSTIDTRTLTPTLPGSPVFSQHPPFIYTMTPTPPPGWTPQPGPKLEDQQLRQIMSFLFDPIGVPVAGSLVTGACIGITWGSDPLCPNYGVAVEATGGTIWAAIRNYEPPSPYIPLRTPTPTLPIPFIPAPSPSYPKMTPTLIMTPTP
jgi:RHS repeat-associated protein